MIRKRGCATALILIAAAVGSSAGRGEDLSSEEFPRQLVSFAPYPGNPVFAGTGKETWDRKIRERGYILHEDGVYHLWYTGYRDGHDEEKHLGYATSPDGLHWTRFAGNPIYDRGWVEDVQVIHHGDTYFMFSEGRDDIAHWLVSKDRIHWQEQGNLDIRYADGKPLSPGPYGTPTVWIEGPTWYLFYERGDKGIWLAKSADRRVWTNVQDDPVLARGPERFDRGNVALNQIVKIGGRYYGYYHATSLEEPHNWTTCVAMSTDLVHWKKYPKNPIISGDKSSGILVHDGTQLRLYTMHPDVRVWLAK